MPMAWNSLSSADIAGTLPRLHGAEPVTRYTPDCIFSHMPLAFYGPLARLVRVQKPQPQIPAQYYVCLPEETIPMDGSIANIHAANAAAPVRLDAHNIYDYLTFRLYFGGGAVVIAAKATLHAPNWHVTLRTQEASGLYDLDVQVSARGEITETQRILHSTQTRTALPPFGV